ncbi:MAG: alkyl hydroperoxide reductase [Flavobacteriaceae bacterium]|nr:alkyl hydroperoxide reductase [Flavobacteriaceae bacterium]
MKPKEKVPQLELDLINNTKWDLSKQSPKAFTMLVFYRGLHCPVCKKYLETLTEKMEAFYNKGVNMVAISMDSEERAKKAGEEWDVESLPIAYGLTEEEAREWGLYISHAIKDEEPEVFSEPALFLIEPDGSLYSAAIQTMPFARPQFDDLLKSIDFVLEKEYPARGQH